jgi:hypothetical protein
MRAPEDRPEKRGFTLELGDVVPDRVVPLRMRFTHRGPLRMIASIRPQGAPGPCYLAIAPSTCISIQPHYILCCLPGLSRRETALRPGPNA